MNSSHQLWFGDDLIGDSDKHVATRRDLVFIPTMSNYPEPQLKMKHNLCSQCVVIAIKGRIPRAFCLQPGLPMPGVSVNFSFACQTDLPRLVVLLKLSMRVVLVFLISVVVFFTK